MEQFFARRNYQIQHEANTGDPKTPWDYLKLLISEKKTNPVAGDSHSSGSLEGSFGHGRQVQAPKPPGYLTQWEHGDTHACWNGMLTHRERLELLEVSSRACPLPGASRKLVGLAVPTEIPAAVSAMKKLATSSRSKQKGELPHFMHCWGERGLTSFLREQEK